MKIQNFKELAISPLRKDALEIINAGLEAIDTAEAVNRNVRLEKNQLLVKDRRFPLENVEKIFVVGIGKCALQAGGALEKILGPSLTGGIVLDVQRGALHKLKSVAGSHPFMTETNIELTKEIINLLAGLTERDLVIFVISGGGSALLCQPENFTCQEEGVIIDCLVASGIPIQKLNTVRKHLSLARGGYLAKYAYPARIISLIFSDVPGNDLEFIASGPTVLDTTTVADAEKILKECKNRDPRQSPASMLIETPKEEKYFQKVTNILLVSNLDALEAMKGIAEKKGYKAVIKNAAFSGEAKELGPEIAGELGTESSRSVLLYGGESTVTIKAQGKGGRNQELALSALPHLKSGELLASVASDGRDNTDFAGALCDSYIQEKVAAARLNPAEYLSANNSYDFFEKTGGYLLTGNTGSNISDIIIAIKE